MYWKSFSKPSACTVWFMMQPNNRIIDRHKSRYVLRFPFFSFVNGERSDINDLLLSNTNESSKRCEDSTANVIVFSHKKKYSEQQKKLMWIDQSTPVFELASGIFPSIHEQENRCFARCLNFNLSSIPLYSKRRRNFLYSIFIVPLTLDPVSMLLLSHHDRLFSAFRIDSTFLLHGPNIILNHIYLLFTLTRCSIFL